MSGVYCLPVYALWVAGSRNGGVSCPWLCLGVTVPCNTVPPPVTLAVSWGVLFPASFLSRKEFGGGPFPSGKVLLFIELLARFIFGCI